jgi:predicted transcriptional regulator
MSLFNVRLPKDIEARLSEEAGARRCSKSDLAREAITAFLAGKDREDVEAGEIDDDWSEFSGEVIEAQRKVFERVIAKLYEAEWVDLIEPLYGVFRKKVIEKTNAFQNPAIFLQPDGTAMVTATIGLAADDIFEVKMPLEDLFYTYCVDAGDEAFDEIPKIWQRAKARLQAEDEASHNQA